MPGPAETPSAQDFHTLGLDPRAPIHEVKKAYRALAKRWHPDRFQQSSVHERRRAEERFKEITVAYRRISRALRVPGKGVSSGASVRSSQSAGRPRESGEQAGDRRPEASPPGQADSGKRRSRTFGPLRFRSRVSAIPGGIWALAVGIVLVALVAVSLWEQDGPRTATGTSMTTGRPMQSGRTQAPPLPNTGTRDPTPVSEASAGLPTASLPANKPNVPHGSEPEKGEPHFTLGSTEAEVLRVQGPPSRVHGQLWVYGLAEVQFRDGRVWRYNNFDQSLKVRVLPSSKSSDEHPAFFTVGSTRDEVLRVQGTPTRIEGNRWTYGFSEVRFRSGTVEDYDNYFGNLKVRLLPSDPSGAKSRREHFTIGSGKDEVLAVQGTPTSIQGNFWFYHLSNILFRDGKVQHVVNAAGNLRFVAPGENPKEAGESEPE